MSLNDDSLRRLMILASFLQHTVTGALGLIFAAFFARSVSTLNETKLWVLYSGLTILHIIANMQCMKLIAFESFNNARMNLIIEEYLTQTQDASSSDVSNGENNTISLLDPTSLSSPSAIAKVEPLFFVGLRRQNKFAPLPIRFGVSLDEFSAKTGKAGLELELLLNKAVQNDKYLLASSSHGGKPTIAVSFLSHASPENHAKAYYHAILLSRQLKDRHAITDDDIISAEALAVEELENTWDAFSLACQAARWDLDKTELKSHGYELELVSK